jgi:mannose-1-phosphate guanylyltransferase
MLLAAGYGERLAPLTRVVPKPLLPVLGRPLAPQILRRLAIQGVDEVVINLHHLPDAVRDALGDGSSFGLARLSYSLEAERLLGTGGGLERAAPRLRGSGTIVVRNSDFLSDISIAGALQSHRASGCPATLVVAPHRAGYTPVEVDVKGRIVRFGSRREGGVAAAPGAFLFTGFHLIEESILDRLPTASPSDIVRDVYIPLAAQGLLNAHVHRGFWWEFGTPREYLDGSMRLVDLPTDERLRLGEFDPVRRWGKARAAIGPGAELHVDAGATTGRIVVGFGVRVGEGAALGDVVIMPEAWIGPRARLRRAIVGPGTEIPGGFEAHDAVIATDVDPDSPLPEDTRRERGLLIRGIEPGRP